MRESPSLHLIEMLQERGANVDFYDPHIPVVPHTRDHPEFNGLRSIKFTRKNLSQYDAVLISTDHDNVDYQMMVDVAPLIVDTRNALSEFAISHGEKY